MWIQEISVDRFGGLQPLRIDNLGPGLTLIIGPNEAGKSTLLEFIRSIFFGFKRKTGRINNYETPDNVPRRGWLTVQTSHDGPLRVERAEKQGKKEGLLTIRDENDNPVDPSSIPILRWGMDRTAYETLFAFDLDAMRELDRESLRGKIVGAALGSLEVNPLDVVAKVDDELKILIKKSTKDSRSLFFVQSRLDAVHKQLRALRERPGEYVALKEESEATDANRKFVAELIKGKQSLLEEVTGILRYEREWKKLIDVDGQISDLQYARDFPVNGVSRFEQALERLREARGKEQELVRRKTMLCRQIEGVNPDLVILENSSAVIAVDRQARNLASRPADMEKLQARIAQWTASLDQEISELGSGWTKDRVAASDPSLAFEQAVARVSESWKICSEKVGELRRRLHAVDESVESLKGKVARKERVIEELKDACMGLLSAAHRNLLGEWKELNVSVRHLRERLADRNLQLDRLNAERGELEQVRRGLVHKGGRRPSPALTVLLSFPLVVGGTGVMVAATGKLNKTLAGLPWPIPEPTVLILVGIGLISLSILTVVRYVLRKRRRRQILKQVRALDEKSARTTTEMNAVIRDRSGVVAEITESTQRMDAIAREVLGKTGATQEDVRRAESRSSQAEEPAGKRQAVKNALKAEQADLDAQFRRKTDIAKSLDHAHKEFRTVKTDWGTFLDEKKLNPTMDPETVKELLRRLGTLKKELRRIADQDDALAAMRREWAGFAEAVRSLGEEMGKPVEPEVSPLEVVAQWLRREKEAREAVAQKKSYAERLAELEIALELEKRRIHDADQVVAALFEAARVNDEESFRERGLRHEEYKTHQQERTLLVRNLVAGLRQRDAAEMYQFMGDQDWPANARLAADLQEETTRLRKESEDLANKSGRLGREIETLEAEQETERLLAEKEELRARLNVGVKRWLTLRLAANLLASTLKIYESEKQPKLMEKSSVRFSAITGGAFKGVRFPMDCDFVRAERRDGSTLDEALLSRGTLEQVYLSMRLAHLEVYHRDESTIPLVMDDILVNFDPERAALAAQVLTDFAEETGIQVLFFTCHPHTAALFKETVTRLVLKQ